MKTIFFSTPMVRAILDERKTMARRVVKFPKNISEINIKDLKVTYQDETGGGCFGCKIVQLANKTKRRYPKGGEIKSPYKVGDVLRVRETWCQHHPIGVQV